MLEIEGFILTGGAARRMGRDKPQLKLGGKTFVERASFALSAIVANNITLVGESDYHPLDMKSPDPLAFQFRTVSDVIPKKQSDGTNRPRAAIIGLYTAFVHAETEWLAVLACDLPFVSGELFERLMFLLQNDQSRIGNPAAIVPIQPDNRPQPLCAIYRKAACLSVAEDLLAGKDWSLRKFLSRIETHFVSYDEITDLKNAEHFFFNVNTPEDFNRAQQIER